MTIPEQAVPTLIYHADPSAPHPAPQEQAVSLSAPQASACSKDRPHVDQRSVYELHGQSYHLNDLEAHVLVDVGKFRVIQKDDLLEHIYRWKQQSFHRDLRRLHRQNLVRTAALPGAANRYIVLTKPAKLLAEKYLRTNPRQVIYAGAAALRQMEHDAALYRLYTKVAQEIEERGGRPLRLILDYELKANINSRRAKMQNLPLDEQQPYIQEIAEQESLEIVKGKILLPDLRIEYEDANEIFCHCDLDYINTHHRAEVLAEKRAAGFALYGPDSHGRKPYGTNFIGGLISL